MMRIRITFIVMQKKMGGFENEGFYGSQVEGC